MALSRAVDEEVGELLGRDGHIAAPVHQPLTPDD
jgi:hypothetical protein